MNDQQPRSNDQYPTHDGRWHGQQPSPYSGSGQLPPAPPYLNATPPKKNWFLRHKVLSGLGALVLVGGIAAAGGSGGQDGSTAADASSASSSSSTSAGSATSGASSSSAATKPSTTKPAAASSTAKKDDSPGLNTPVRDGKFEFTVTKVQTGVKTVGDQYLNQKAQGQFVLISVKVTNIGNKPQTMFDSNQELTDAQGRTFSPDSGAAIYMQDNDIWMKEINPGNTMTGTLVYDMPAGAKPAQLELHDSMFSGGTKVSLTR